MTRYKISCKVCQAYSIVDITPQNIIIWEDLKGVISGRLRLDNNWGWQCKCGNNSLMTKQEERMIADPSKPTKQEIDQIVKNIKAEQVVDTPEGLLVNGFIMKEL